MKKLFLFCFAVCFSFLQVSAQKPSFVKGDNVVGLGVGFGNNLYSGSGYKKFPAISLSYENCIKDNLWDEKSSLGIGGYVGYASAKYEVSYGSDTWGWKYSNIIIGARGVLHYAFVDKLDTYTGLILGYDIVSAKEIGNHPLGIESTSDSKIAWSWFLGARYYFSDSFGAFAELGYGIAILNLGVSLKF